VSQQKKKKKDFHEGNLFTFGFEKKRKEEKRVIFLFRTVDLSLEIIIKYKHIHVCSC